MFDLEGVIGSLVLIGIIVFIAFDWIHRWRSEKKQKKRV